MKRIYKNNDLVFNLTIDNFPINKDLIESIEFKFYTLNQSNYILKTQDDIDVYNQVILQWDELKTLEEGVLFYDYIVSVNDNTMRDSKLDTVSKVMTNYYIVSESDSIDIPTGGTNVDLSDYYTKSQIDIKLSDYVEEDVLGSYYTKNEVNDLLDNVTIGDGEINLNNYYTKSEVDAKIPKNYITSIPSEYVTETELSSKLTGYSKTNHTHNYLTSIPSEYITESELSAKGYLTQHQSLNNYYTKGEVDTKLRGYSTSGHTHSQYLTQHQSLSGYAKLTDIPTDYVTESKLNSKGYLTAVPSEYITETELEAKGYLTAVPKQYVTEAELEAKDYISVIPSEYITETELERKGYLTEHQPLTNYYTKSEVNNLIDGLSTSGGEVNLTNYYTKSEVDAKIPKNYLTSIPSEYVTETELSDYYTKTEVDNKITESGNFDSTQYYTKGEVDAKIPTNYLTNIPSEYVTETELNDKGYLTQHQSLENYYTKTEVDNKFDNIDIPTGSTNVDLTNYYTKSEIDEVMLSNHLSDISFYNGKLIGVNINGNTRNEIEVATINGESILGVNKDITIPIVNTSDYYTKTEVDNKIPTDYIKSIPSEYITETELNDKGYAKLTDIPTDYAKDNHTHTEYLTEHQSLEGYAKLTDIKNYDDTALVGRVAALESELTGVSELITKLNDMIV